MTLATHRQHMGRTIEVKPRFESKPYRQSPGRRTHIFGPLVPMDRPKDPTSPWFYALGFIVAAYFILRSVI